MLETPVCKAITVKFEAPYLSEIVRIRNQVFSIEQGIDAAIDLDGRDGNSIHALVQSNGRYVATGRLLPDGHIGRLAVLKSFRNNGLGRMALKALENEAKRQGLKTICLAAQKPAVDFYEKQGFVTTGPPFYEVGIEHINMEKAIKGDAE